MTKKDNLNKCLLEDVSKIKFKGIYVPNLYVFDKDLINKYYENRIIKVKYLSSLLVITETTVSRELKKLEELGYIKSELAVHKNITLGKRYYVQVKPI